MENSYLGYIPSGSLYWCDQVSSTPIKEKITALEGKIDQYKKSSSNIQNEIIKLQFNLSKMVNKNEQIDRKIKDYQENLTNLDNTIKKLTYQLGLIETPTQNLVKKIKKNEDLIDNKLKQLESNIQKTEEKLNQIKEFKNQIKPKSIFNSSKQNQLKNNVEQVRNTIINLHKEKRRISDELKELTDRQEMLNHLVLLNDKGHKIEVLKKTEKKEVEKNCEIACEQENIVGWKVGYSQSIGINRKGEDTHLQTNLRIVDNQDNEMILPLFAVFDGHGGQSVSEFLAKNIKNYLEKSIQKQVTEANFDLINLNFDYRMINQAIQNGFQDIQNKLKEEFLKSHQPEMSDALHQAETLHQDIRFLKDQLDQLDPLDATYEKRQNEIEEKSDQYNTLSVKVSELKKEDAGSNAAIGLIWKDKIFAINLGDSRIMLFKQNEDEYHQLTRDQTTTMFRVKIQDIGGEIRGNKRSKHGGASIEVPFALGDILTIGGMDPQPEITIVQFSPHELNYLVIVCDGITDVMGSSEILQVVKEEIKQEKLENECAEAVRQQAFLNGATDDLTVVVANLKQP